MPGKNYNFRAKMFKPMEGAVKRQILCIAAGLPLASPWYGSAAQTNRYYVNIGNVGQDAAPYSSWATAATNLFDAVDQAEADIDPEGGVFCDVVVADGVYIVTNALTISQPIRLYSDSGDPETTAISGSYPVRQHRVLHVTGEAWIRGFTVSNGYAYGESPTNYGGGVFMTTNRLGKGGLLSDCRVIQNQTSKAPSGTIARGAGIYIHYGGTVSNCLVQANTSTYGHGSGIFLEYGGKVYNSEIDANDGSTGVTTQGGGIYLNHGGYVTNCLVTRNVARWPSGIMFNSGGEVVGSVVSNHTGRGVRINDSGTLRDSLIAFNILYGVDVYRGGSVIGSIIENNNGCGIRTIAQGVIDGCIVRYNHNPLNSETGGKGGGINQGWQTTIRNSLVYGNVADADGGGIYATDPRPTIENCTIVRNQAQRGGGLFTATNDGQPFGVQARNLVVYDNLAVETNNVYLVPPAGYDIADNDRFTYSCTTPVIPGEGNIEDDPRFRDPGSEYGLDAVPGDWRLRASSPCRDSGLNDAWMADAADVRGLPRILPEEGGLVDMGAYENIPIPMATVFLVK